MTRFPTLVLTLAVLAACDGGTTTAADASCPSCDVSCATPDEGPAADVVPDAPGPADAADAADATDPGPAAPTYWSAEATRTVDDLRFVNHQGKRFFALGVHPQKHGAWDGLTGPDGCSCPPDDNDPETPFGDCVGRTNDGLFSLHEAHAQGANFVYTWGYDLDKEFQHVDPPFYGLWQWESGQLDARFGPGHEPIPTVVSVHGETTLGGFRQEALDELKADFEDFKARRGRWSKQNAPHLPPYEEMPWFGWHPTPHMKGGGDGMSEMFTDKQADAFAKATNFMIADTYSYVCNRWEGIEAVVMGQKGPKGECYDDWLARDDPDHREYFSAAFDLAWSLRRRADPDAVVWMWMQGHAFDDDIGGGVCGNGESNLWASGPFPTLRYLRKEMMSSIVAGSTGLVFFGYGYCRQPEAQKVRSLIRALAWEEVMGPALLSPRLDVGEDLLFTGEGGRAHLMIKWDAASRTAYVLGANPGAHTTPFEVTFPWTVEAVEVLDWWTPAWIAENDVAIADRTVRWVAPQDEGFILRVTPLQAPDR